MQLDTSHMHIISRACNQPQLLEPTYAATFFGALALRSGVNQLIDVNGEALRQDKLVELTSGYGSGRARERPYQVIDGLAILPISGTLLHKYGYVRPVSGATGYDGIISRLHDAISDPDIRAVMLDIDSPGGEGAGCFDCAEQIRKLREIKPIYALCYDTMCSAAMALGSACTERWITQSGRAGSVGVLVAHTSYEKKLEDDGVDITLIHSGMFKVDGNPYQSLPTEVQSRIKANIDKTRDKFAQLVSGGIGISAESVLNTEAQVYTGQEAIDVGFADKLVNGPEAVPLLLDVIKSNNSVGVSMSTDNHTPESSRVENGNEGSKLTQADVDSAKIEGAKFERARIGQILNCEHAEGRQTMAAHLALSTDMSADQAIGLLQVSPKEQAQSSESKQDKKTELGAALDAAMGEGEQPNLEVSSDAGELTDFEKEERALLSAHDALFGKEE